MSDGKDIWVTGLSKDEKKELEISKAKSNGDTWKDFFLELVRDET